mgnify:CR=1 FL=1
MSQRTPLLLRGLHWLDRYRFIKFGIVGSSGARRNVSPALFLGLTR